MPQTIPTNDQNIRTQVFAILDTHGPTDEMQLQSKKFGAKDFFRAEMIALLCGLPLIALAILFLLAMGLLYKVVGDGQSKFLLFVALFIYSILICPYII